MTGILYWDNECGKKFIPIGGIESFAFCEETYSFSFNYHFGSEIYTGHVKLNPQKFKEAKGKFEDWFLLGQDLDFSFLDFQDVENEREDPSNVASLRLLLKELNQTAPSEIEKGRRFEILALAYLQSEPKWKKQFRRVWLFADWAKEHPDLAGETYTKDIGIDLVAENIEDGKFTAIQCKFYKRGNKLDSDLLNTFLRASDRVHFTRRILVTTNKITTVQRAHYRAYTPPIEIAERWLLENAEVHWNSLLDISFEQVGRNPPFSVKPEDSWKKSLMDSVDKTSKKTWNYHKDVEPVLRWLKNKGILKGYREEKDGKKERRIVLIPNEGLKECIIRQPRSLDEIAEKIRYRCLDRDPYLLARSLLEFSTGKGKGQHGETHKEIAFTIWEVTDMWDNIATMIFTAEYAIKAINGEIPPSQEDHYIYAYDLFKEAEIEFRKHEEMFKKCCMRLNEKYQVNNLEEVKKYLSQF